MSRFLLIAVALGVAISAFSENILEKRLNYSIVLPDKPSAVEKFAGNELKEMLEKVYTKPIRLNGTEPETITFFVGLSAGAAKAGFVDLPGEALRKTGFGVFKKGDSILLAGIDDPGIDPLARKGNTGTLLGVCYFLKKYSRVIWFAPGKDGESFTLNPPLAIANGNDVPTPGFSLRSFRYHTKEFPQRENLLFLKRSLGHMPIWSAPDYSYFFLNQWNRRFAGKPEYFSLFEGKRLNASYPRHFPCASNPEVLRQIAADLAETLHARPDIRTVRLFSDAPVAPCECPECSQKYGKESDSGKLVYEFFNRIAHSLRPLRPDLHFTTQTKGTSYSAPPRGFQIEPGSVVEVLTGRPSNFDEQVPLRLCEEWKKAGAVVMLKSYPRYPAFKRYPLMNPVYTMNYFKKFKGKAEGELCSDNTGDAPYSFCALNNYVQGQALFHPDRPPEEVVAEFCAAAYPGAETEMTAFYAEMEKLIHGAPLWDDPRFGCYAPDRLKTPAALLDAAAKKCSSPWLEKLRADFGSFRAEMEKSRPQNEARAREMDEYRKTVEKTPVIIAGRPTAEPPLHPLWALKIHEDFQPSVFSIIDIGDQLQINFAATEKNLSELHAECTTNHEGSIWNDDVFEVFFSPLKKEFPYLHIAVNPNGNFRIQRYDSAGEKPMEVTDSGIAATARRRDGRWFVTLRIPFAALEQFVPKGSGKIGVFRSRAAGPAQSSGLRQSPGGRFHNQEAWVPLSIPARIPKSLWQKWF